MTCSPVLETGVTGRQGGTPLRHLPLVAARIATLRLFRAVPLA